MTRRRIHRYATLIALAMWTILVIDYSVPGPLDRLGKAKGTDFLQFYVAGSFAREGRPERFYDLDAEHARGREVAPTVKDTVYVPVQSPQTALVFAPLTAFSYSTALAIWIVVVAALYAGACRLLWADCGALRGYRREVIACGVACPAFYSTVLHGQLSAVSLAAICLALAALRRGQSMAAGLALGALVFKPHWPIAAAAVFIFAREWRVVAGIAIAAIGETALTWALAAPAMAGYLRTLRSLAGADELLEPRAGYALRSFFTVFVPWPPLALAAYAIAALAALVAAGHLWRSDARFEVRASAIVLAFVLITPHVFEYDLLVLTPVFFLLANAEAASVAPARSRVTPWALAALFLAPLLTAIPAVIRLQFAVTPMVVLLWQGLAGASSSDAWTAWRQPAPAVRHPS